MQLPRRRAREPTHHISCWSMLQVLGHLFMLDVLHATCKPCWRCEPKIPPRCSTWNLDRCKAARCGHHSTGWAARHMHASLKVRTEFPTLILHSKLGIVVKPGRRLNPPCLTHIQ